MNPEPELIDAASASPPPEQPGRIARITGRARETAQSVLGRLEALRPRSWMVDTGFRAAQRHQDAAGGVLAAALGLRVFLLLIPYVLLLVLTLGSADDLSAHSPGSAARAAGITGIAARSMADAANLNATALALAIVAALWGVLSASRTLLRALGTVHRLVWRMRLRRSSTPLLPVIAFVGGLTLTLISVVAIGWLRERTAVIGLIAAIGYGAVPALLWMVLARHLPHPAGMTWRDFVPGAALVACAGTALHVFTVYWITREVASKSDEYGAFGVALALLLWAYVLGRILIGAAVVTAAAWFREHPENGGALVGTPQSLRTAGGPAATPH